MLESSSYKKLSVRVVSFVLILGGIFVFVNDGFQTLTNISDFFKSYFTTEERRVELRLVEIQTIKHGPLVLEGPSQILLINGKGEEYFYIIKNKDTSFASDVVPFSVNFARCPNCIAYVLNLSNVGGTEVADVEVSLSSKELIAPFFVDDVPNPVEGGCNRVTGCDFHLSKLLAGQKLTISLMSMASTSPAIDCRFDANKLCKVDSIKALAGKVPDDVENFQLNGHTVDFPLISQEKLKCYSLDENTNWTSLDCNESH